jgi:hypothetical protein
MTLDERDYMRSRSSLGSPGSSGSGKGSLLAIALIAVAALGWYGYRQYPNRAPAEGSLRVNINTATRTQIETLPGIGPALAERIIAGRPYASVDDLARVRGIGAQQVRELRPKLTVSVETHRLDHQLVNTWLFGWVDSIVHSYGMLVRRLLPAPWLKARAGAQARAYPTVCAKVTNCESGSFMVRASRE